MQVILQNIPDPHCNKQRGIFAEGCQTVREVMKATLSRSPPFQQMPPQYQGLTTLCQRLLDKVWMRRYNANQALADSWFHHSGMSTPDEPGAEPQQVMLSRCSSEWRLSHRRVATPIYRVGCY